jgi:hypothetical protein
VRAIPDGAPEHVQWGVVAGLVIGGLRWLAVRSSGRRVTLGAFSESLRQSRWGRAADGAAMVTLLLMVVLTLIQPMQQHGFRIVLGLLVTHAVREAVLVYPTYRLAYDAEARARTGRRQDSGVTSGEA